MQIYIRINLSKIIRDLHADMEAEKFIFLKIYHIKVQYFKNIL